MAKPGSLEGPPPPEKKKTEKRKKENEINEFYATDAIWCTKSHARFSKIFPGVTPPDPLLVLWQRTVLLPSKILAARLADILHLNGSTYSIFYYRDYSPELKYYATASALFVRTSTVESECELPPGRTSATVISGCEWTLAGCSPLLLPQYESIVVDRAPVATTQATNCLQRGDITVSTIIDVWSNFITALYFDDMPGIIMVV